MVAEREICVSMCISFQYSHYTCVLSPYSSLEHFMEANQSSKEKKPSDSLEYTPCTGPQPLPASCNSTFWVIFSSCFADWSWLRYSITLKLAVVNFSCNAFTSGLSAFEEKNVLAKNKILREKQIRQDHRIFFFPDPCKCFP